MKTKFPSQEELIECRNLCMREVVKLATGYDLESDYTLSSLSKLLSIVCVLDDFIDGDL